jgi:hypothetical protein
MGKAQSLHYVSMDGYRIGQTWFRVQGTTIEKITLLGYVPNREKVIYDIEGVEKRMEKTPFKEWELELIPKRADAVILKEANELQQLNDEIAFHEAEALRLKAERDGTNG